MRFLILWATICLSSVCATPSPATHVLHEKREQHRAMRAWTKRSRADAGLRMPMRIGLQQTGVEDGHELFMDVSHHLSPNYGKWYTAEQVHEIFAPSEATVQRVRNWLHSSGIAPERVTQSVNKQWLQFDATVREAEDLLHTEYYLYEHTESGRLTVACDEYHVPSDAQEHIDYITPGIRLIMDSARKPKRAELAVRADSAKPSKSTTTYTTSSPTPSPSGSGPPGSSSYLTPEQIRNHYKIPPPNSAEKGNELGLFETAKYSANDLKLFLTNYAKEIPSDTKPITKGVDGGEGITLNPDYSIEPSLDIQVAYPLIYPQQIINFQVDDNYYASGLNPPIGFFNTFLDAIDGSYCTYTAFGITGDSPKYDPVYPDHHPGGYNHSLQCGVYKPPNVVSFSYGHNESILPINYQRRQCNEYMKLGMQGVSLVFASDDSGVEDRNHPYCDGKNHNVFSVDFPAGCPYVTAVGGTVFTGKSPNFVELSWNQSGGGFSNIYPIPTWQNTTVQAYLNKSKELNPHITSYCSKPYTNDSFGAGGGNFNRCGRGIPDVSAIAENIAAYDGGQLYGGGGTSAAAPIFASVLTRINEKRLASGKSTVGFVNPVLYENPHVLNDIGQGLLQYGCPDGVGGFKASQGWDPVTGLGSPNFPAMLDLFMSLP